jgi:DNA gyrase/topoisomerase IV subunit A
MDKELKRKLFFEILSQVPYIPTNEIHNVITALLSVDDVNVEEAEAEINQKEIAELTAKKAEAEKVLADTTAKLSLLTKEILITK